MPANDFLDIINEFHKEFDSIFISFYWLNQQDFVSEIITPYGLCFSFNLPTADDFIVKNLTSNDFHYELFYPTAVSRPVEVELLPRKTSTSIDGLYMMLYIMYYNLELVDADIDGLLMFFHDPFELPTSSSVKYVARSYQASEIKIQSEIYSIDDSLIKYSPERYVCEYFQLHISKI